MASLLNVLLAVTAAMWCGVLLLPWRPWSREPHLDADGSGGTSLEDVTALIPARNEAPFIQATLRALADQGESLRIVLVDDQSSDATAQLARSLSIPDLIVLTGEPLPPGWSGKLWALEQGRQRIETRYTLLLDADIELAPGIVAKLREKLTADGLQFISLLAAPRMVGFWDKLLLPAFVYFFKLLYPFRLANGRSSRVAAAAGGCILMETRVLNEIGGFAALKDALIDDCTLAQRVKSRGHRTWLGLTHAARSLRPCHRLGDIWRMVARNAFTQLRYSTALLGLCTLLMVLGFWVPVAGLLLPDPWNKFLAVLALAALMSSYLPTLAFYGRSRAWALFMPLIGTLYLTMTWSAAIRYWRGERARWKGRSYGAKGTAV